MSFTYDGTLGTDFEKVRLEIGDTDSAAELFSDTEIEHKIDDSANLVVAAATLCDILARRFARAYDFETDGQSFKRSQMSKQYAQLARDLRQRSVEGFVTLATTRVDGYSDDVDYQDVDTGSSGRVRIGYVEPDLPD
ncbi:MAG: hypothetical protein Q8R92_05370 [Deltaproteobacteria bacterium]|nr:hypothetical protein [Deltaproteobacteria bacterium]